MNLLKKTTPWMAASLMAVASIFGQDKCSDKKNADARSFEQGQDILKSQSMASYNAPAGIDIRGAWDFFVTGSFIYWQPTEDNLQLGVTNTLYQGIVGQSGSFKGMVGDYINMDFSFKPGFKVGLGMNLDHDNWDLFAEYTWLRDTSSTSSNGPAGGDIIPARGISSVPGNVFNSITQKWTCNLDFLNLEMGRSCYVGKALTMRPAFGVRGTLMRQKLHNTAHNTNITANSAVQGKLSVQDFVHSWAIGPRVAVYSNWLLGQRFRLYGNVATDVTFSQYDTKYNSNFTNTTTGINTQNKARNHHANLVRNHIETELGIGWGSYFDNNNWYFDLSAGYTWQVFFNENMFSGLSATNPGLVSTAVGNLYINGLTVNVRFDF